MKSVAYFDVTFYPLQCISYTNISHKLFLNIEGNQTETMPNFVTLRRFIPFSYNNNISQYLSVQCNYLNIFKSLEMNYI